MAMKSVQDIKETIAELRELIGACNDMLVIDPDDQEALDGLKDSTASIADLEAQLVNLEAEQVDAATTATPATTTTIPPPPPPPAVVAPQVAAGNKSSSPIPAPPSAKEPLVTFDVNDNVMAKYSGDRTYYAATIVSRTGSNHDPIYKVKFHGYGDTETKNKFEVKSSLKRKADDTPPSSTTHAPERKAGGPVISAAASIDMSKMNKKEPSKVGDGPAREKPAPKKLKRSKQLEETKNSWQDFKNKGPKKVGGRPVFKESQFRTQEDVVKKGTTVQPKRVRVRHRADPDEE
ncbi:hypothetical protein MBLNU230_g3740t1 [Neophaeotheca triangularis]